MSFAPGNPSLEKCRALKERREEAAEVASLDITNIISSSGEDFLPLPKRWGLDFLRQLISRFSCPPTQAGHADAQLGTRQEKLTPQGSYTAGLWAQMMSSPVSHLRIGHICVASSAVMERVTELLLFQEAFHL